MVSSKVVLTIPIVLATSLIEDLLTCLQPDSALCEEYLHGLTAEISLIFIPSLLSALAVTSVSVFALKLQLRLNRAIHPMVTLPPPANVIQMEARTSAGVSQTGGQNREDTKIFYIEDVEPEESGQPQSQSKEDRKEGKTRE